MQIPQAAATPDNLFNSLNAPPDGDFEVCEKYQSRHYPLWCDTCQDWHIVHYELDIGRASGRRWIEIWYCEGGAEERDLAERWTERDGVEKFGELMDRFFGETFNTMVNRALTMYYDWVVVNRKDPLQLSGRSIKDAVNNFMIAASKSNLTHKASVH